MRLLGVVALAVGCGRIGFDSTNADDADVAHTGWQLVQVVGTTQAPLALAPTQAGSLIVVALQIQANDVVVSVADDVGNQYVRIPRAHAVNTADADGIDLWYKEDAAAGATMISAAGTIMLWAIVGWEVSGIRRMYALDTAAVANDHAASTTAVTPALTIAQAGELVIAAAITPNRVVGMHAGNEFTSDVSTKLNGWAHITDVNAARGPHVAQWDLNIASTYLSTIVAFFPE
jgi:hypothetical protein